MVAERRSLALARHLATIACCALVLGCSDRLGNTEPFTQAEHRLKPVADGLCQSLDAQDWLICDEVRYFTKNWDGPPIVTVFLTNQRERSYCSHLDAALEMRGWRAFHVDGEMTWRPYFNGDARMSCLPVEGGFMLSLNE